MVTVFYIPLIFQPSEGITVGHSELFTAKFFSAKREDYMVTAVYLMLNFQPNDAMTIGHGLILYS